MDPIYQTPDGLARLIEVMRRLRDPDTGCPWDIEQDFSSIAPYTIEEAYEVADAIEQNDMPALEGELGDLLLQVVYHGQMGAEAGHFDVDSIARRSAAKMIDRHPHVFGDEKGEKTAEQQTRDWETTKAKERGTGGETRTLDGVALGLPALLRALKLQKRLSRVGFDWGATGPVLEKLVEEVKELEAATNADEREGEFGDLLFVMVNLARHWGIDPEAALRRTNAKVERRFGGIEDRLAADGRTPSEASLDEMDALWNAIKADEKASK